MIPVFSKVENLKRRILDRTKDRIKGMGGILENA
jgi:hypothetical protein